MDTPALLRWYERSRRPLPWRFTRDPYALLVSEVMLQQTQAARVVPFYERFLERFPDPQALAAASSGDVLSAWSGLGYNRRALALQGAATRIVSEGWPRGSQGLRGLPGIGAYTAAAVASFAWDEHVAAVDSNVRRVIARFDGVSRPPRELADRVAELLASHPAAQFNQATMELGATTCTPRRPRCAACPVAGGCASAGRVVDPPRRPPGSRARFEDTDRWLRGRVIAALVAGEPVPGPGDFEPGRLARVLAGLERDGLLARSAGGIPALP